MKILILLLTILLTTQASLCHGKKITQTSNNPDTMSDNMLTEKDAIARSSMQGCQLIPYDNKRTTCINENMGLHNPTACGSLACKKSDDIKINKQRLEAWQLCVHKRTAINSTFTSTLTQIKAFQRNNSIYGRWNQKAKNALGEIVSKIQSGTNGHNSVLNKAKQKLKECQAIVN